MKWAPCAPPGRRRGACPRETRVHDMYTRYKRRDGAWVVETCDHGDRTSQAMGGGTWRRRFCGRTAPLLPHRSAKRWCHEAARIYTW